LRNKFCASSWLNTEINILRCSTVSKTSKRRLILFSLNDARINMLPSNLRLCLPHDHFPSDFPPKMVTQNLCLRGIIQNRKNYVYLCSRKSLNSRSRIEYMRYALHIGHTYVCTSAFVIHYHGLFMYCRHGIQANGYTCQLKCTKLHYCSNISKRNRVKNPNLSLPVQLRRFNVSDAKYCLYMSYRDSY